mgnify:CR=1 FL=1
MKQQIYFVYKRMLWAWDTDNKCTETNLTKAYREKAEFSPSELELLGAITHYSRYTSLGVRRTLMIKAISADIKLKIW